MTDILGPGSGTSGVATARPVDDRIFGSIDTWMRDCSSDTADDGTAISAAMLNSLIANLRALARGNGALAGGGNVVAEDNSDLMLVNAVIALIQRGRMHVASDSGGANALVAVTNPVPAELVDGMVLVIRPAAPNTGATTIKWRGETHPAINSAGDAFAGGELAPPAFAVFRWNAAAVAWQLTSLPASVFAAGSRLFYGADSAAAANQITATLMPTFTGYQPGQMVAIKVSGRNNGSLAANLSALGNHNVVDNTTGLALIGGETDDAGDYIALFIVDSAGHLRLVNPLQRGVVRFTLITATRSFTPIAALADIQCIGAGASGRNVAHGGLAAGQGGGAGETRWLSARLTPGVAITATVGLGALAGSSGNGGASSFGTLVTSNGGVGVLGGSGGAGGLGLDGADGETGFTNGVNMIVIGRGGRPALYNRFGVGGDGGDGGLYGNELGRAGLDGGIVVMERSG